jgi:hypothetical protein
LLVSGVRKKTKENLGKYESKETLGESDENLRNLKSEWKILKFRKVREKFDNLERSEENLGIRKIGGRFFM